MTTVKYEATVISVGEMAEAFAAEGILVFFGEEAPEELHEFAILIDHDTLHAPVEAGDILQIGTEPYPVLCVGDVANENLAALGHLIVKFNGRTEPELPGDVSVPVVPAPNVTPGTVVRILKGEH